MRHKIWKKDDAFDVGGVRVEMDASAVELPETAPLVWGFSWDDAAGQYGTVTNLRIEDGEITGEIDHVLDPTFDETLMEEQGMRLGGFYSNVTRERQHNTIDGERVDIITSCMLRGVSIINIPQTPLPKEN